ncbi:MAG: 4-hydroxybenzoate octaprenyltransferase [Deltaproteobacteria bacterium]|nr:4-hydroxybenzoate octaprenyltransferase [Deltaproteobacteria bacterium]
MTAHAINRKFTAITELIRFKKQYGTILLLSPALWSLFIASEGRPEAWLVFVFVAGAFLMRSAGCAINDIADRNLDKLVERTRTRPLPTERLSVVEATVVFSILVLISFALVLTLNTFTIKLSVMAIVLAVIYPFIKRISHLPQAFLGIAFGWGAVMAWGAVAGEVALPAWLLFTANIFWALAYDTIYALLDVEHDRRAGIKSSAILFGDKVCSMLTALYIVMAALIVAVGVVAYMGAVYYATVAVVLIIFLLMVRRLKKEGGEQHAMSIFVNNAWLGLVLLGGIIIDLNI